MYEFNKRRWEFYVLLARDQQYDVHGDYDLPPTKMSTITQLRHHHPCLDSHPNKTNNGSEKKSQTFCSLQVNHALNTFSTFQGSVNPPNPQTKFLKRNGSSLCHFTDQRVQTTCSRQVRRLRRVLRRRLRRWCPPAAYSGAAPAPSPPCRRWARRRPASTAARCVHATSRASAAAPSSATHPASRASCVETRRAASITASSPATAAPASSSAASGGNSSTGRFRAHLSWVEEHFISMLHRLT